jgi:hypothetical protein
LYSSVVWEIDARNREVCWIIEESLNCRFCLTSKSIGSAVDPSPSLFVGAYAGGFRNDVVLVFQDENRCFLP